MENVKKQVCSLLSYHGGDVVKVCLNADIGRLRLELQALASLMGTMALALVELSQDPASAMDAEGSGFGSMAPEHFVSYA